MATESSKAYDLPQRLQTYDTDMDIMHPLRWKMIEIALEVLPFPPTQSLRALDLGVGTGAFARSLLERYPNSTVVAVDGAAAMLDLARERLGELSQRVEWVLSDFQDLGAGVLSPGRFDVVISAYALHHLNAADKLTVLQRVGRAIKPGAWLLNADIVVAETADVEARIQDLRVAAVTQRAPAEDVRFQNTSATRRFLDDLEATEHDQPQTVETDIRILRQAGIAGAELFWKQYREVVIGGPKAVTA